jgi:imidazole glycerol-phosphate synthase subunit HisH
MIIIIDYNLGNVDKLAESLGLSGIKFKITKNENDIIGAEKVILPGTEEAFSAVKKLHLLNLFTVLRIIKKPVLGIGLGMQLLSEFSREGDVACLGKFIGIVEKFDDSISKVPFYGDYTIKLEKESKLFQGINITAKFRFRNSFYIPVRDYTLAIANNGINFSASIQKDNFYGVQFHPEESGVEGLKVLKNFSELK